LGRRGQPARLWQARSALTRTIEIPARKVSRNSKILGDFSIIVGKSAVTWLSKSRKFLGQGAGPRRALPCSVRDSIPPTRPRASSAPKICPKPGSFDAVATFRIAVVRVVESVATGTTRAPDCFMTWVTWFRDVPKTSTWSTRFIAALNVEDRLPPTPPTTPGPKPTTRTALSLWRCDW
jgi:hypothetical protein